MPDTDVEALVLLIEYSEQEAVRLRLSPVVVHCLRMASEELNSTARAHGTARFGIACTRPTRCATARPRNQMRGVLLLPGTSQPVVLPKQTQSPTGVGTSPT